MYKRQVRPWCISQVVKAHEDCPELQAVLDEYHKPVVIQDQVLGELKLDLSLIHISYRIHAAPADLRGDLAMSLPKRDGVNNRYYLIHKPDTSPEVLAEADLCIQDVLNGTARENHSAYPTVVRNHNGTPFLPDQLLERYLTGLPLKEFPCEDAVSLCDACLLYTSRCV